MGQFKSHITCDKCGHESILFDPYKPISPLPAAARVESHVYAVQEAPSQRPLKVIVAVQSKDTVGALKQALAKVASLDGSALWICVTPGAIGYIGPFPIISPWSTSRRMTNSWRSNLGREIGLLMFYVVGSVGMRRPIANHLTSCSGDL